jgi:predicted GH43/DUF377 family glycosyl hydrolase
MKSRDLANRIEFKIADGFPKIIDNIQSTFGIWHVAAFHDGKFYILFSKEVERSEVNLYISSDGENFIPYEKNPVMRRGNAGEFDDARIEPHGLVFHNGKWLLYYGGYSWNFKRPIIRYFSKRGRWRVGLAQSSNLTSWEKHPLNPIFSKNIHVADPRVAKFKDKFFLYYLTSKKGCYVAHSDDGLNWQDYHDNPIFDRIVSSFLVKEDMLIGFCRWGNEGIGVALSNDGFKWIYAKEEPIIKSGMIPPWDSSGVIWPFLAEAHDALYLYYSVIDNSKIWRMAVAKLYVNY